MVVKKQKPIYAKEKQFEKSLSIPSLSYGEVYGGKYNIPTNKFLEQFVKAADAKSHNRIKYHEFHQYDNSNSYDENPTQLIHKNINYTTAPGPPLFRPFRSTDKRRRPKSAQVLSSKIHQEDEINLSNDEDVIRYGVQIPKDSGEYERHQSMPVTTYIKGTIKPKPIKNKVITSKYKSPLADLPTAKYGFDSLPSASQPNLSSDTHPKHIHSSGKTRIRKKRRRPQTAS